MEFSCASVPLRQILQFCPVPSSVTEHQLQPIFNPLNISCGYHRTSPSKLPPNIYYYITDPNSSRNSLLNNRLHLPGNQVGYRRLFAVFPFHQTQSSSLVLRTPATASLSPAHISCGFHRQPLTNILPSTNCYIPAPNSSLPILLTHGPCLLENQDGCPQTSFFCYPTSKHCTTTPAS